MRAKPNTEAKEHRVRLFDARRGRTCALPLDLQAWDAALRAEEQLIVGTRTQESRTEGTVPTGHDSEVASTVSNRTVL